MRKIFMIGDSLMMDYHAMSRPQFGYGELIKPFVKDDIIFINLAKAGRSTKSFIDDGRFEDVIKMIEPNDLLIVEFGNNDEKETDPKRYTDKDTTFKSNLKYFADTATSHGSEVIFMTSPTRNNFDESGLIIDSHKGYPLSMAEFAIQNDYYCIELNEITKKAYNYLGQKVTDTFHLIYEKGLYQRYLDGNHDTSHFNYKGALFIASIIIINLEKNYSRYNEYFNSYKDSILFDKTLCSNEIDEIIKEGII